MIDRFFFLLKYELEYLIKGIQMPREIYNRGLFFFFVFAKSEEINH